MVDYKKWDMLAAELSSDEEEGGGPSVTVVNDGESVSIGPSGPAIGNINESGATRRNPKKDSGRDSTRNGGVTERYMWNQSSEDVIVKVPLQDEVKAKEIKLIVGNDSDSKRTLLIPRRYKDGDESDTIIIQGTLRYPIAMNEEDGEDPIDWEITYDSPHRYLTLTMKKKSPIPGAVHWWNAVFLGDAEIDVEAIPDRLASKKIKSSGAGTEEQNGGGGSFADNWAEAHRLFCEKIKIPEILDVDEGQAD